MNPYRNRKGEPITVEEWGRLWSDWEYRHLAEDTVGTSMVLTIWNGFSPHGMDARDTLFSSAEVRRVGDETTYGMEEWYTSEEDAIAGHRRRVEALRKAAA